MPRTWKARPSTEARSRVLGAVRALLTADEAGEGWGAGYGVTLSQLRGHLQGVFAPSTLKQYVAALVASGDLIRLVEGVYTLPSHCA